MLEYILQTLIPQSTSYALSVAPVVYSVFERVGLCPALFCSVLVLGEVIKFYRHPPDWATVGRYVMYSYPAAAIAICYWLIKELVSLFK